MNCSSCGTPLQQGIPYCPACRMPTPYLTANPNGSSASASSNNMGMSYGSQQAPSGQFGTQHAYGYPPAQSQEPFHPTQNGTSYPTPQVAFPASPFSQPGATNQAAGQFGINGAASVQPGSGLASFPPLEAYSSSGLNGFGTAGAPSSFSQPDAGRQPSPQFPASSQQVPPMSASQFAPKSNSSSLAAYRPGGAFAAPSTGSAPMAQPVAQPGMLSNSSSSFAMPSNSSLLAPSGGAIGNQAAPTQFGGNMGAYPAFSSQFGLATSSPPQPGPTGTMAPPQNPYAMPSAPMSSAPPHVRQDYNNGHTPEHSAARQQPARNQHTSSKSRSSNKGRLAIIAMAVVLVLLAGGVGWLYLTNSGATAQPNAQMQATPKPVAASNTVPSMQSIVPAAAAIISNLQLSSSIDNNILPTHVTTAFTTDQTVYATFMINAKKQPGFIQVQWYENNQLITTDKITHDGQSNVAYFYHKYNAAGDGAAVLYWCHNQDCSDAQLAQIAKFNVTATNGAPATNPTGAPTSWQGIQRRSA